MYITANYWELFMCKELKFVLQVYDISNAQNCPAKYINLSVF